MHRVEIEGDSQSSRRRNRSVARSSLALKPHLRRLALEGLEDRTLMYAPGRCSTLPSPVDDGAVVRRRRPHGTRRTRAARAWRSTRWTRTS